jgi:hypothetical protein
MIDQRHQDLWRKFSTTSGPFVDMASKELAWRKYVTEHATDDLTEATVIDPEEAADDVRTDD